MKVIFLDIDGVLTSRNSDSFIFECDSEKYKLNDYCLECLKYILDNVNNCKIVLSTSWRNYPDNHIMINTYGEVYKSLIPQLKFLFGDYIVGKAPHNTSGNNKYTDISDYLSEHSEVVDFVVMDDDPTQGLQGFGEQFFKISMYTGLTLEIAKKVVDYFNN